MEASISLARQLLIMAIPCTNIPINVTFYSIQVCGRILNLWWMHFLILSELSVIHYQHRDLLSFEHYFDNFADNTTHDLASNKVVWLNVWLRHKVPTLLRGSNILFFKENTYHYYYRFILNFQGTLWTMQRHLGTARRWY